MIWEALRRKSEDAEAQVDNGKLDYKELTVMALATSIDALMVGITFAFLKMPIVSSVLLIGLITFVICAVGVLLGHYFGTQFKKNAEVIGGTVLILIGIKVLLEHLEIIKF